MTQQIWRRLPDETAVWFARFEAYRLIGPARSIDECYRRVSNLHRLSGARPGQAWYKAADKWRWQERAEAWDEDERERLMAREQTRRFDAREARLGIIERMMGVASELFVTADMATMTKEEARSILPQMRLLLRDMLNAQRLEMGLPVQDEGGEGEVLPFTADELARARRELASAGMGAVPLLDHSPSVWVANGFANALTDALARLYPDEQSARRVATQAGIDVARVKFGSALNTWHEIVEEAQYSGQVDALMALVGREYGASVEVNNLLTGGMG